MSFILCQCPAFIQSKDIFSEQIKEIQAGTIGPMCVNYWINSEIKRQLCVNFVEKTPKPKRTKTQ